VLNALSSALKRELDHSLTAFELDPAIRCVVIAGSGDKAFSAGGDIHEMAATTPQEMAQRQESANRLLWRIANLRMPVIGAINGLAYGGGAYLASTFDIRLGCENTKFRFLAAQYGQLNSTWTLPTIVGWARAKELIFTGRTVHPEEAHRLGLLNELIPAKDLMESCIAMATRIAGNSAASVELSKRLLNEGLGRSFRQMCEAEIAVISRELVPTPVAQGFEGFLARGQTNY